MEDNKELLQLSNEDLEGLNLESQFYIPMELENLENIKFDKKEFDKGLKDVSKVCGMLTGLINAGLSSADALNYILNKETIEHNFRLQQIVNENNVKVAEVQELKIQGQTL